MSGNYDDRGVARDFAQPTERVQAVHPGQPHVENHDVRFQLRGQRKGRFRRGRHAHAVPLPLDFAKLFAYSDVTALPLMILLYLGAIVWRKDRHLHSRLVSATLLAGLLPASARMFNRVWPGMDGLIFAMHPTYLFELAVLAIAIFIDWKNDRLRWPFPFAFAWLAVSYATLFPGSNAAWFDALARWIGSTA